MDGSSWGQGSAWMARLHDASAHALYLHVPFCVRKCAYCDFASRATQANDPLMAAYVRSLRQQMREAHELGLLDGVQTAYVGGGTPTLVGASLLGSLVGDVRELAPGVAELSCETNPDSLGDEVLQALVRSGATRVSIGVQSLNDAELQALGRVHDARTACERVRAAVASGLDVSCDLMCATPCQDDASWQSTLAQVAGLAVGHVSVYPLQLEEGTPLGERWADEGPAWNDSEVQAKRMEAAAAVLGDSGYVRYEVASYAREGKACRHNQAYWTGRPYLGLGVAASSMLTREGYRRLRRACVQLPVIDDDVSRVRLTVASGVQDIAREPALEALRFDIELLDEAQAAAEDLMLGMRLSAGVGPELLGHARSTLGEARVDGAIASCVERGLAAWDSERLEPTHDGWLLGNELYGTLWDLAPGEVREASA